jgi:YegS/Rv2252/BmrU family lipid kinase
MNPAEVPVILNPASGTGEASRAAKKIAEAFRSSGLEPKIIMVNKEIARAAATAVKDGHRLIVAGGGDGTISSVASGLIDTGAALGVLPLGTFNHFARDLGIPLDPEAAVRIIAAGKVAQVDMGEVNGRTFINNSSVGLYPRIVLERRQEQRTGHTKRAAFFLATWKVLRRFHHLQIKLATGGTEIVQSTAFVFVGNNQYEIEGPKIGTRRTLNAGELFCYVAHATTRWQLLRLVFDALIGRLRRSQALNVLHGKEAVVTARRKRMRVALDGEVATLPTPLHYRIRPGALRVIVP